MDLETAIAAAAAGWLAMAMGWLVRSVQYGRRLAEQLELCDPDRYEALGSPRPGYFDSVRRSRFSRFVMRAEFRSLTDPALVEQFEAYRRTEIRGLVVVLSTLAAVGAAVVWLEHIA
jgi:hypothetical protein